MLVRVGLRSKGASLARQVAALFASSEQGAWYDPSDLSTLFQDSAGTTPVTAAGQPVGKILDKSGRGNHATQSTATARPVFQQENGLSYLSFDGVDDSLVTQSINFTATDKMTVVAGVRIPGTVTGMLLETSASANTNPGAFYITSSEATPGGFTHRLNGSTFGGASTPTVATPHTSVVSWAFNIAGAAATDEAKVKTNGVSVALTNTTGVAGTGNYGNYPLYIGRRAGASIPFNGRLYGLIVRGAASSDAQITKGERYLAQRTGVTL